jgi:hypothetical protein
MNELLMQRCVDDELSSTERGEFLAGLGDDVVHWKQLACRLMEDRVLEAGCREWLAGPDSTMGVTNRIAQSAGDNPPAHWQNGHAIAIHTHLSTQHPAVLDAEAGNRRASTSYANMKRILVPMIAGVLGIALGLGLGSFGRDQTENQLAAGRSDGESDTESVPSDIPQAPPFSTIRLTVDSPDGPRSVELPVVGSGDLQSLASTIEAAGVITLPIDDATRVAVPVQAVQMRNFGL